MLRNLTKVADYKGLTIVESKRLRGKKYGVKFIGHKEVFVSPAVFDLLLTDFDAVAKSLKVHELPSTERAKWVGRKSYEGRVLP